MSPTIYFFHQCFTINGVFHVKLVKMQAFIAVDASEFTRIFIYDNNKATQSKTSFLSEILQLGHFHLYIKIDSKYLTNGNWAIKLTIFYSKCIALLI